MKKESNTVVTLCKLPELPKNEYWGGEDGKIVRKKKTLSMKIKGAFKKVFKSVG